MVGCNSCHGQKLFRTGDKIHQGTLEPERHSGKLTSSGNVVQMAQTVQSEEFLEFIDSSCICSREDLVDLGDHLLDVRGAVSGHVLANWVKITPEIRDGLDDSRRRISSVERIRFTTDPRELVVLTIDVAKTGILEQRGTGLTLL